MKIKQINTVLYDKNYTTNNIIEVVLQAYKIENDSQIRELANQLKGDSTIETCRNIWKYLIEKVSYKADGIDQKIKSPARLIHDASGDCKSYSVFTACILRYLNIKHFFRFTSYSNKKEATHVYVVAVIDNQEIPIDAVAYVQMNIQFGSEATYKYRADMTKIGKIMYLAGLHKNKIGNITNNTILEYLNSDAFKIWTDQETDDSLTLAKGFLVSEWDKYWTVASYASSTGEKIEALNRLQYIAIMIRFYNEYRYNDEMLVKFGKVIAYLIEKKEFDSNEVNPNLRKYFTDFEYNKVLELLSLSSDLPDSTISDFWQKQIVEKNTISLNEHGNTASISEVMDVRSNLKKTGGYYIYSLAISDNEALSYSSSVRKKRVIQNMLLNKNKTVITSLSQAEIENYIFSGCTETWKATPSEALKAAKKPQVGEIATVIATITAIVGIISSIIGWFKKSEVPSQSTIEDGLFNPDDIISKNGSGGSDGNSITEAGFNWMFPLLLVGATLFVKPKKKKK